MAKRIELINSALVITDNVTSKIEADVPKRLVYYDLDKFENDSIIQLRNIDRNNEFHMHFQAIALADAVGAGDVAYTAASWRTFARTNLGS